MRAFWSDPYLWVHAAGVVVVPIALLLCLFGFAIDEPILPPWLELGLVGIIGIAPVAWMQWQRPFYIFSLVAVALRPEQLTDDQRRILSLFRAQRNPIWIGVAAVILFILLQRVYTIAPIAAGITPLPIGRTLGLGLAAIGFLASNLFLQVPLSVLQVMLVDEQEFAAVLPIAREQIPREFSIFGLRVNRILPSVQAASSLGANLPSSDAPSKDGNPR